MRPMIRFLFSFAIIYGACLGLLSKAVVGPSLDWPWLWTLWLTATAFCLMATAFDLAGFCQWLCVYATGKTDSRVLKQMDPSAWRELKHHLPTAAIVVPACNECATPADRDALVMRSIRWLSRIPQWMDMFFLFDSDAGQHLNEMNVIDSILAELRRIGHSEWCTRVRWECYRDKPQRLRNKPGSVVMWLDTYAEHYTYLFMLDADSELAPVTPSRPQVCHVVERMIVTMLRDPNLAMIQASIEIHDPTSPWGWVQAGNAEAATNYHLPVMCGLYESHAPCYGHNVLFRSQALRDHARNTLDYTSHDHVDSSDLAAAGWDCIMTANVVTFEHPESSLVGYLKRDQRWAQGNGQWLWYLLTKRKIPLGPFVFLSFGVAQYLWPLAATVSAVCSALLLAHGHRLLEQSSESAALVVVVLMSLALPKWVAFRSVSKFAGNILASVALGPAITVRQGIHFLFGFFGDKWIPRSSRADQFNAEHVTRLVLSMSFGCLIGCGILTVLPSSRELSIEGMLWIMALSLIASPLTATVMSCPMAVFSRRACSSQVFPDPDTESACIVAPKEGSPRHPVGDARGFPLHEFLNSR